MGAFAFYGKPPTCSGKRRCWAFEKIIEVYEIVAEWYRTSSQSTFEEISSLDLSSHNPDTGAIAGVIDWEMAGFR